MAGEHCLNSDHKIARTIAEKFHQLVTVSVGLHDLELPGAENPKSEPGKIDFFLTTMVEKVFLVSFSSFCQLVGIP